MNIRKSGLIVGILLAAGCSKSNTMETHMPSEHRIASEVADARDTAANEMAIRNMLEQTYVDFVSNSDPAGYASMYSDDVLWSPPGVPDATSLEKITAMMTKMFSMKSLKPTISIDEVNFDGTVAWVTGSAVGEATISETGKTGPFNFRALWILQKDDAGAWKIIRQIWNNKPI